MIVDSFAWIEFLGGTPLEPLVRRELATADRVVTPDLVLAEIARKLARHEIPTALVSRKLHDISTLSHVAPVSLEIALGVAEADDDLRASARSRRLERPGLADAVVLATARVLGGKVLTGDPHFHGLPETLWLGH